MSMDQVQCRTLKILFPEETTFTVGESFQLVCPPPEGQEWQESSQLILNTEEPFLLRILSGPRLVGDSSQGQTVKQFEVELASYIVGKNEISDLKILSGGNLFAVSPIQLEVRSVQDPEAPAENPIGPLGPSPAAFPLLSFSLLVVVGAVLLTLAVRSLVRKLKKRKYLNEIKKQCQNQTPESLLFKEWRATQSKYERAKKFVGTLEKNEPSALDPLQDIKNLKRLFVQVLVFRLGIPFGLRSPSSCLRRLPAGFPSQVKNNIREILDEKSLAKVKKKNLEQQVEELVKLGMAIEQVCDQLTAWLRGAS